MSRHAIFIIVFMTIVLAACASYERNRAADASFDAQQREALKLEYQAFDQTMGEGWRAWSDRGEHPEAARMLDHYASTHDELTDAQWRIICFHSGQMYGWLGERETAIERFRASLDPEEPVDSPFKWNAYVLGTIAFLERDKPALQQYRDELAAQAEREINLPDGTTIRRVPNLDVLDRFVEHFDRSYREAYTGRIDGDAD